MLTSLVREPVTHSPDHASVTDVFAFDAILLAGTHAWRRTAFDQLLPRPVLPVAQLPLMAHPLRWLRAAGASRVTICANGGATQLREHLDPVQHLLPALTFHEDPSPRGAAGSARDAALASDADLFVVADATTIPDVSLLRVLLEHQESRAALTVIVQPSNAARGTSLVPTGLYGSGLVPTGLYIFSRRAFEYVPAAGYQDIKESLIPRLYAAGELVVTSEAESHCPRVLDARTYLAVSHRAIARSTQQLDPLGAPPLDGMPSIHPSAHVSPSALLVGPVLVGRGAEIHDDAVIVGPASIGAHSVVGRGALISRSVVWDHCTIGETAAVDRSVLASGVSVAAGASLVGAIQVGVRPAPAKDPVVVAPHPAMEPAVNARGLAFR
ncbi:MAG TPA: NDP-sugar synthase [Vicinamibacterales bacterium]|nr:NDP-sugar synthase [Vicinamibacterales bacterium]